MSCKNMVMQGDQYPISFSLKADGELLDITKVDRIQFTVGETSKLFITNDPSESEVVYEGEKFYYPISEEESFKFEGPQEVQIRIKFIDGHIVGKKFGSIDLQYSNTEERLDENMEETANESNES